MGDGGGATTSRHDRSFLIKAERKMLHRDTTSSSATWDPLGLANVSDAAMVNVTNASLLSAFYLARQQRYRGVGSPRWAPVPQWAGLDNLIWPNGTRNKPTQLDDVAEAFELMTSPVSGQRRAVGGEASVWNGVDTLMSPVDAAMFSTMLWEHQPELIMCAGSHD